MAEDRCNDELTLEQLGDTRADVKLRCDQPAYHRTHGATALIAGREVRLKWIARVGHHAPADEPTPPTVSGTHWYQPNQWVAHLVHDIGDGVWESVCTYRVRTTPEHVWDARTGVPRVPWCNRCLKHVPVLFRKGQTR